MSSSRRPPRQLPAISNLPALPTPFVGRDEQIADAHRLLMDRRAVLVHDPEDRQCGYGTSQLAISYAYLHNQHYELIWIFDCCREQDKTRLRARVERETERLQEDYQRDQGEPLTGPTAANWLYIFDNVDDPDIIRQYFPEGNARILVTSRRVGTWDDEDRLCVEPLKPEVSVKLLQENMGLDQLQATQLADIFDGHPQQIVRAGEAVLTHKVTVEQIVTVTEIARLAPPPAERPAPTPAVPGQRRADGADGARTSLRSSLMRSAVCWDPGRYRSWVGALRLRTTIALPSDALIANLDTMAERVDMVLDTVFAQKDPDLVRALSDTVRQVTDAAGSGRQMADNVQRIAEELVGYWQHIPQTSPAVSDEAASCFFLTSWHNRDVDLEEVILFHKMLEKRVTAKLGGRVEKAGFLDKTMKHGSEWEPTLIEAIRTTRLLIPLITEGYFTSEWCRREWAVMVKRMASLNATPGQAPIAIMPVFWVRPLDGWKMPDDFGPYQHLVHVEGKQVYDGDVYDLVADGDTKQLTKFVSTLAKSMVAEAGRHLPHLDKDLVKRIPLAFPDANGGAH
ncbi:TIR domain-containing protein [Streptomyces sp. NPDC047461]|uniref:TIR domain-containing protein n=1 Tax=Streptomyces sp. NPDC047461 TaxID=3155619 RepID=UPI0033C87C03